MKSFATFLTLLISMSFMSAQEVSPHALGLRLDGSDGLGPEISYQRALGDNNRLELDLGFADYGFVEEFKITGIYQWVMPLGSSGFNWYAGVGGGLGIFDGYDGPFDDERDGFTVSVDGMIGIEYSLLNVSDIPLMFSLDINPEFEVINDFYDDDIDLDAALGIRFQF